MANRFYTVLIVPEKTSQVRRFVVPSWLLRGAAVGLTFAAFIAIVMVADYWYVMNQINENKDLKLENRRLRQQVQVFQNKMATVESTMDRVKTFSTRLKVIMDIQSDDNLLQSLNKTILPDANTNVDTPQNQTETAGEPAAKTVSTQESRPASALTVANASTSGILDQNDPNSELDDRLLQKEYDALDGRFTALNRDALYLELMLQDQYELLADKKAFLSAVPDRKPAVGYFTSGFGVRRNPTDKRREKMHEGFDIANRIGTPIVAPADGVVDFADLKVGYGKTLILDHGYGLKTWYAHLSQFKAAKGQKIKRGQLIAKIGNSGHSTGPHLHYEVRVNGIPVDPRTYLLSNF